MNFSTSVYFHIFLAFFVRFSEQDFSYSISPSLKIIGGNVAFPHSLGYQVGIKIEKTEGHVEFCGGSLISDSHILTAAHCLQNVHSLEIILGAHNITKNEWTQIRLSTRDFTVHKEWNSRNIINDIALIKLPKPVKPLILIRTISLPKNDENDYAGQKGLMSGWGITEQSSTTMSNVLMYAKSTILTNQECIKIHPFDKVIKDTHLCLSGSNQISSCEGDSGGPLVVQGVLVGINSFTLKNCNLSTPSVFTRVSKYLRWIEENSKSIYRKS